MSDSFNYQDKSAPKLSDEFKHKFTVNIKGKDAIKLEGLTAFAHEKGLWKLETEIIQFPNDQNQWTCICKTTVGGYDWDPAEGKVVRVEYTDIGDANAQNCTKMVANAYIRMASTRSQGRALRKYTNIDMVCSSELSEITETPPEPTITTDQLIQVKQLITTKKLDRNKFSEILFGLFGTTDYNNLTEVQGNTLLTTLQDYTPPAQ